MEDGGCGEQCEVEMNFLTGWLIGVVLMSVFGGASFTASTLSMLTGVAIYSGLALAGIIK